jgi:hypothetical protein
MMEKKIIKCPSCGQEASLYKQDADKEEVESLQDCCRANLSEAAKEEARRLKFDMPVFY